MERTKKFLVFFLALVLVFGVLGLAGCNGEDEKTDEGTEEKAEGIRSVDDLKDGDKVGVQSGTTGEQWARENLETEGIEVVVYDDILAAFAALQAGDVVGVINDIPISLDIAKDPARGVEVVQEIQTDENYGFGFNKENTALRDAVNWALAEVIASGEYDTIYEKWFAEKPMSIPAAEATAEEPADAPKTLTSGKILIGSDTAYPPFENVEDGETVGFDVDMMKAIGEKLGLEIEFKTYKFDALITGLQSGTEFDMTASAMTINDDRKQSIDFSNPYISSNQSLAVKKAE
ncbi:MAG: transporter substrate-binding domain-containing protein [Coriobacteriia bacterium]|nr:transporter substrate-binding domain-containing protein [Coriobacteriia bacterium]